MDDEQPLDSMILEAYQRLAIAGDNPLQLSDSWRTTVLITSAQRGIDNGGLVYVFENDWATQTSYEEFSMAYDRIGKSQAAETLRRAVAAMGIENAENQLEKRREYIERNTMDKRGRVTGWGDSAIVGDETVWTALASWLRSQQKGGKQE